MKFSIKDFYKYTYIKDKHTLKIKKEIKKIGLVFETWYNFTVMEDRRNTSLLLRNQFRMDQYEVGSVDGMFSFYSSSKCTHFWHCESSLSIFRMAK